MQLHSQTKPLHVGCSFIAKQNHQTKPLQVYKVGSWGDEECCKTYQSHIAIVVMDMNDPPHL